MKEVYLVQHSYQSNKNQDYEKIKELGIYSDRKKAEEAIDFFMKLPGFNNHSRDCFHIGKIKLDENHWEEGFINDQA